ncbi:hypothetical protein LEP1GSC047_0435 [Leptospira inadai serovar Lyme str. 10]|uniref:Uncharacterized protein n=2 Tax=Leptospira inadai serovar Lyme TaxID=293084 RepID=V6H9L2_9LEPT|nr:hypothetical protein [Leptospira inadai]EQA35707.1 hypothetical protein LEP1GSC047_0435 [Leptospira inadai serovar Lyme str. 10]PNV76915.1 hypothetical protein BES34_001165 [Leptospira inadai serovar Lyme]
MKKTLVSFVLISVSAFYSGACVREDLVSQGDSNSQIYAAAKYLATKCGDPIPTPYPVAIGDVQRRNLDLCSIAITKSDCPFVSYPIACLLIYLDKPSGDIPWYENFKDAYVTPKVP